MLLDREKYRLQVPLLYGKFFTNAKGCQTKTVINTHSWNLFGIKSTIKFKKQVGAKPENAHFWLVLCPLLSIIY